ncbi:MAG: LysR substrate-binding domain-containing protein [Cellvibrionaceae bacterium]
MRKFPFALNTLYTFTVAARELSFKAAAEQLHLSASAISRQIQSLESSLNVELFIRKNRALELTHAGQLLLESSQSCFDGLFETIDTISSAATSQTLRLSVLPYFANNWLLPRLSSFTALHPNIQLSFESDSTYQKFNAANVDGCFRFSPENREDLVSLRLFRQYAIPVASPELLARHSWSGDMSVLSEMRWFDSEAQPDYWSQWKQVHGYNCLEAKDRLSFGDAETGLQAAREGLGVVMGAWPLIEKDLQQKKLVALTEPSSRLSEPYYFVYSRENTKPALAAMIDWLEQFQTQD